MSDGTHGARLGGYLRAHGVVVFVLCVAVATSAWLERRRQLTELSEFELRTLVG